MLKGHAAGAVTALSFLVVNQHAMLPGIIRLPEQGGSVCVVGSTLTVGPSPQSHDVVPALLDEHADDALNAVANEVAPHLHTLLLGLHQLSPDSRQHINIVLPLVGLCFCLLQVCMWLRCSMKLSAGRRSSDSMLVSTDCSRPWKHGRGCRQRTPEGSSAIVRQVRQSRDDGGQSPCQVSQVASVTLDHDWHDTHFPVQPLHAPILQLIADVQMQGSVVCRTLRSIHSKKLRACHCSRLHESVYQFV